MMSVVEGPHNIDNHYEITTTSSTSTPSSLYETAPIGWHSITTYHQSSSPHNITMDINNYIDNNNKYDNSNDDRSVIGGGSSSSSSSSSSSDIVYNKRVFNERDIGLKFIAREEFGGYKEGFVFRLGAQGLGYYEDVNTTTL